VSVVPVFQSASESESESSREASGLVAVAQLFKTIVSFDYIPTDTRRLLRLYLLYTKTVVGTGVWYQ